MEVCEPVKMSPKKDTLTSPSPNAQTKGLKQVRLPFKQLDQKIVSPVTSGKKRKLSSGESSASKITKTNFSITPKSSGKPKLPIQRPENVALKSDENEVSSSSEAENIPLQDGRKSKPRFIEKFLEAAQQREVSTSGEVVDLSLEMEEKDCDISGVTAQDVEDESKEESEEDNTKGESGSTTQNSEMEVVVIDSEEGKAKQDVPVPTTDKKVSVTAGSKQKKAVPKIEDLFSAAAKTPSTAKRSGDEMVTSAKVLKTSELQTPQSSGCPSEITSPESSSAVKVTPTSAVVEKKTLSSKKKQEKEMERLKKKEEKEKERLDKQKQRDEAKAEKDRKKQEEKDKKEQERLQKEREKQEKKEQAEKERLDKLKQKEEDKQRKLEALEEEKRKREDEKKKKEDEKRIKEEEKKKDEEEKNLKAKAVFTSFFIKPETSPTSKPAAREETGLFRGFYVNKDMTLAPSKRAYAHLEGFDSEFESQECGTLYLDELKSGSRQPVRTGKLTSGVVNGDDDVVVVSVVNGDDDVVVVSVVNGDDDVVVKDDKADVTQKEDGDPESEDGCPKTMKTKYLKFKENNRPAYRGTWRKKSNILTPRNPFKMDKDLFDYEYDSDDDWEEEEPGESLSNSEGEGDDEDDKPSNDAEPDDDEDGFFVPHGYLSEDEGCDEAEELNNPEKLKALQIAKAKAFEMEIKRKCEYMRAVVIGCCWMNATHQIPEVYSRLEAYEAVPLSSTPIITTCNKKKSAVKDDEKPKSKGFKKKAVPEEAIPDLIKYIHCNVIGIQKLVRGFRTLWHKKMHPPQATPEVAKPEPGDAAMDMDAPKESTETPADGTAGIEAESESPASATIPESECAMSKRQLELKITSMATYQKGPQHYRKCWYVKPETLKAYNLEELQEKVTERKVNKSIDKKDLNKSVDGPQPHCATLEVATPKSSRTTPSVTITQFTVKADPEAKWQLEKLPPKPAPAAATPKPVHATPGKVAALPAPVGTSPAVARKASAHRIQLTTLTNFMKPKPAKCTSPDTNPNSVLSAVGASQNVSSGVPATSGTSGSSQLNVIPSNCQVIDLTDELSNEAISHSSGGSGVPLVPASSTQANHLSTDAMVPSSSDAVSVQTNGAETRIVAASSVDSASDKKTNDVEMTDESEVIVLE